MIISIDLNSIRYSIDERKERERDGNFLNSDFNFDVIKFLK